MSNRGYACDLAEVGQGLCDCHHRAPNQFIIAVIVGVLCMHCHPDAFVRGGYIILTMILSAQVQSVP